MTFAALAATLALVPAHAQQVAGRELFQFPLGSLAEAPALATAGGGGFWNPATLALGDNDRFRAALAVFDAPIEQGVSAQLGTVAFQLHSGLTAGLSVASASVNDLRAGMSYQLDEGGGDERYYYASGQASVLELRAGLSRESVFHYTTSRLRVGVGVHYAHYLVGVVREDGTEGLSASYQFFLSTVIPKVRP